jgi:hypothetical protein
MEFFADLLHLYQQKSHIGCRKKADINSNKVEAVFTEQVGTFFKNKHLRIGDGAIT